MNDRPSLSEACDIVLRFLKAQGEARTRGDIMSRMRLRETEADNAIARLLARNHIRSTGYIHPDRRNVVYAITPDGEDMIDAGGYAGAALRADMAKDRPGPEQPPQAPEPNQVLGLGRDGQSQATSIAHPAQNHRSKSRWWSWSDFTTRLVVAVVILLLTWFVMWLSTGKVG